MYQRLVRSYQNTCAEKESSQLFVNHLKMQTSVLQQQNRKLSSSVDELKIELSESAERELILQVCGD